MFVKHEKCAESSMIQPHDKFHIPSCNGSLVGYHTASQL